MKSTEPSDGEIQEFWDKIVDSAVRVGVAIHDGDKVILNKDFQDHTDIMLEMGMMDSRILIIWEQLDKRDMLSDLERDWMAIIGDFMVCNNKFSTARKGDWHNAVLFVTSIIKEGMEEDMEVEDSGV